MGMVKFTDGSYKTSKGNPILIVGRNDYDADEQST